MGERLLALERALKVRYEFQNQIKPDPQNPLRSVAALGNVSVTVEARNEVRKSIERLEKAMLLRQAKSYLEEGGIDREEFLALKKLELPQLKKAFGYQPDQPLTDPSVPEGFQLTSSSKEVFPRKGVTCFAKRTQSEEVVAEEAEPKTSPDKLKKGRAKKSRKGPKEKPVEGRQRVAEGQQVSEVIFQARISSSETPTSTYEELVFGFFSFIFDLSSVPDQIKDQVEAGLKRLQVFSSDSKVTEDPKEQRERAFQLVGNPTYLAQAVNNISEPRIALHLLAKLLSMIIKDQSGVQLSGLTLIVDQEGVVVGTRKGGNKIESRDINYLAIPLLRVLSVEGLLLNIIQTWERMKRILSTQDFNYALSNNSREKVILFGMKKRIRELIQKTNWQSPQNWKWNEENKVALQALVEWVAEICCEQLGLKAKSLQGIVVNIKRVLNEYLISDNDREKMENQSR